MSKLQNQRQFSKFTPLTTYTVDYINEEFHKYSSVCFHKYSLFVQEPSAHHGPLMDHDDKLISSHLCAGKWLVRL